MAYLTMTPDDIQGDYSCKINVEEYRLSSHKKVEYKVVVQLSFYSSRAHATGHTSWHIWRSFSTFRKLDEQLRKRTPVLMKGVKFPPLYRRRALFRADKSLEFLGARSRELDNYMNVVTHKPQLVAFHLAAVSSQTLKNFVGFNSGFGANAHYDQQDAHLRPSSSILASSAVVQATASVKGDDEDDFRSVSSTSTVSSFASMASDYRWSGTGFVGSQSFAKHSGSQPHMGGGRTSFASSQGSFAGSTGPGSSRGSWFPASSNLSSTSGRTSMVSVSRGPMMAVTASDVITPELDMQRAKMEDRLVQMGLVGVGMPPDGSCLLHCIVYEMYPLQCLRDYPASMTVVNVGAADGMAPRRVAAAQFLRVKLMEYALKHIEKFAGFLMQDVEDVQERYETFRNTVDEQATTAELYAVASMFNIELVLISNDESFVIDPVVPLKDLPCMREGPRRTVTLGYLIPADGLAGHYICTREKRAQTGMPRNTFAGGSYRGSIHIGPPKGMNCGASTSRRFDRIPEQRVE
uniref:PX domain-containing protein n=1 Tax=Hyaloperonospora arabidopsidis (strain Emoy2) TaxID=559515 RepID=M4BUQ1_HYAAE